MPVAAVLSGSTSFCCPLPNDLVGYSHECGRYGTAVSGFSIAYMICNPLSGLRNCSDRGTRRRRTCCHLLEHSKRWTCPCRWLCRLPIRKNSSRHGRGRNISRRNGYRLSISSPKEPGQRYGPRLFGRCCCFCDRTPSVYPNKPLVGVARGVFVDGTVWLSLGAGLVVLNYSKEGERRFGKLSGGSCQICLSEDSGYCSAPMQWARCPWDL